MATLHGRRLVRLGPPANVIMPEAMRLYGVEVAVVPVGGGQMRVYMAEGLW